MIGSYLHGTTHRQHLITVTHDIDYERILSLTIDNYTKSLLQQKKIIINYIQHVYDQLIQSHCNSQSKFQSQTSIQSTCIGIKTNYNINLNLIFKFLLSQSLENCIKQIEKRYNCYLIELKLHAVIVLRSLDKVKKVQMMVGLPAAPVTCTPWPTRATNVTNQERIQNNIYMAGYCAQFPMKYDHGVSALHIGYGHGDDKACTRGNMNITNKVNQHKHLSCTGVDQSRSMKIGLSNYQYNWIHNSNPTTAPSLPTTIGCKMNVKCNTFDSCNIVILVLNSKHTNTGIVNVSNHSRNNDNINSCTSVNGNNININNINNINLLNLNTNVLTKIKDNSNGNCNTNTNKTSTSQVNEFQKYECKTCGKKLKTKLGYMSHMNGHLNIYPYICQYCNKKFTSNSSHKRHELLHKGEKLFQCKICLRKFSFSAGLKSHMVTHTKEKPFECNVCKLKFTQSSSLRRHQRNSHQTIK